MNRNIEFNMSDNPAKIFGVIIRDLDKIAEDRKVEKQEIIQSFIRDLQNLSNQNYEKEIKEISIKGGLLPRIKSELISYLNKMLKVYKQTEKINKQKIVQKNKKQEYETIWKTIEETLPQVDTQNTRLDYINKLIKDITEGKAYIELNKNQISYVLKKLTELVDKESTIEDKEEEDRKRKVNKKWKEITDIVNKAVDNTGKSKLEIWDAIKQEILGKDKYNEFDLKVSETIKDNINTMIDEEVKIEGTEYYEDVKRYTQNFDFLMGYRGVTFAIHGHRKFLKPEYARMFENLIEELRKNENVERPEKEDDFLKRMLSENVINTYYGKKIIEERINKIEKDKKAEIRTSKDWLR